MTHSQIDYYFLEIERVSKKGKDSYFFCANRVEKIPTDSNAFKVMQEEPPNRFYEYPWQEKNERLIDEVSRLHRLCNLDAHAIRLERIT